MRISLPSLLVVALATEVTVAQNWAPGWTSSWFSKAGKLQPLFYTSCPIKPSCLELGSPQTTLVPGSAPFRSHETYCHCDNTSTRLFENNRLTPHTAYNKWHETELERWLSDHNVPYPTPADRADLENLVKSHWNSKIGTPYTSWETPQLQSYLKSKGADTKKAADTNKDTLVGQVKSYLDRVRRLRLQRLQLCEGLDLRWVRLISTENH